MASILAPEGSHSGDVMSALAATSKDHGEKYMKIRAQGPDKSQNGVMVDHSVVKAIQHPNVAELWRRRRRAPEYHLQPRRFRQQDTEIVMMLVLFFAPPRRP